MEFIINFQLENSIKIRCLPVALFTNQTPNDLAKRNMLLFTARMNTAGARALSSNTKYLGRTEDHTNPIP
jgi:hypothetical protein